MKTFYTVMKAGDSEGSVHEIDWPEVPSYDQIKRLVTPLLGEDEPLEHVTVLYDEERRDMFVSELGHMRLTTREPMPRNDRATEVYRAAWLQRHPEDDPEDSPWIAGTAVLFQRIVWT